MRTCAANSPILSSKNTGERRAAKTTGYSSRTAKLKPRQSLPASIDSDRRTPHAGGSSTRSPSLRMTFVGRYTVNGAEQTAIVGLPVESGHPGGLRVEKATATPDMRKGARRAVHPGLSSVGGAEQQILAIQTIRPGPTVGGVEHVDFRD